MIQHKPQFLFDPMAEFRIDISDSDVAEFLTPSLVYDAVLEALRCHARGDYVQPLKPYVRPGGREDEYRCGRGIAMPAFLGDPFNVMGLKWITGFPINVERGLPRASAILVLNSAETGRIISVMDATSLSSARTGAIPSICFDHLAVNGPKEVALLGAGPIIEASVKSLTDRQRDIAAFRIYDPREDRMAALIETLDDGKRPPIVASRTPEDCVRGAKVVVAATTGSKGYLEREWVDDGTLIIALSLDDPTPELMLSSAIIVDDFDQCNREEKLFHRLLSDGRLTRSCVRSELGQVVSGGHGRESETETVVVNPMGMAIEDLAVGYAIHQAAIRGRTGLLAKSSWTR